MRKTLVAVAAALAFGSLSAHAGDVQMYGVIDVGFSYVHSDADQPGVDSVDKFTMENASEFGSRWGIRGTEDLGNGYKVGFKLESGFNADTGTLQENRLFRREAGLTLYGPFGSLGFGRFGGIAARQRITRRTVGDHGCIAAVARAVPDVGSFGYDRTGNRPVVGIHVAGEIAERAERRAVAPVVAQEREERVDVLGLVVGPDRGIETLAAGTVHQAALGVVDALRSADFRKGEHGVDHGIGGVQHQIALPFGHQRTAFGALRVGVQRQGFVPGPAAAEKGPESDLGPRSEHQRRVAADLGHQFVTALHALCRSCPDHRTRPGNLNVKRLLARILQDVFFAEGPNPTWSEQRAVVFEDPQKEMYQGTFLSLKPYMKYFDIDILEERILSAGMANEEQILLPMTYDYFLYAFTTQDLPENTEISRNWLELARQKEKAIQQIVGQRSGVQFFDTFSEVVDYKKKTLLYSEEQIKKVLDETAALKTRSLALNWKIKDTGVVSLNDLEELGGEKTVHTVFAMPNQEGGFTANVTLYAGINKNTKQPLKAVSFLQMLYSEEVLSGKGIELEDRREASNIRFPQGVSIYKKELEKRMRSLSRQDQKQIKTIQEEVKTVRFYSIWDRELNSLLSKYEAQEDEKQKEHVFTETIQKWKEKIQK